MDAPHTHPRATELLISVNSTLRTGMITENGARIVVEGLQPDDNMTVFPLGSIHFQINDSVSFRSITKIPVFSQRRSLLCLPLDVVGATFGDLGVLEVAELASSIPDSFSLGTSECLRRCGLQRNRGGKPQPTAQQQPRISGNAFPSGVLQSASRAPSASKSDAPVYAYGNEVGVKAQLASANDKSEKAPTPRLAWSPSSLSTGSSSSRLLAARWSTSAAARRGVSGSSICLRVCALLIDLGRRTITGQRFR